MKHVWTTLTLGLFFCLNATAANLSFPAMAGTYKLQQSIKGRCNESIQVKWEPCWRKSAADTCNGLLTLSDNQIDHRALFIQLEANKINTGVEEFVQENIMFPGPALGISRYNLTVQGNHVRQTSTYHSYTWWNPLFKTEKLVSDIAFDMVTDGQSIRYKNTHERRDSSPIHENNECVYARE